MSSRLPFLALFDEPGPRAHRRIVFTGAVSAVVLAVVAGFALLRFAEAGQLEIERWRSVLEWGSLSYLLDGLRGTLLAAVATALLGLVIGLMLAIGRLSRSPVLRVMCRGYVEVARSVPVLLLLFLFLFALPQYGINPPLFWKLVIPLTIANAAAFAEIIRAAILSIDRGQGEAASALGLRDGQSMRLVVLPQALRRVVPALVSQTVGLLKDTSLGFLVSYGELLYSGRVLSTYTGNLVQTYAIVAALYFAVNAALSYVARRLERSTGARVATTRKAEPVSALR